MNTSTQGMLAETQAMQYLEQKGYKVLLRNFRATGGEIDIVALQKNTLIFVEVKQRRSQSFGGPQAAVTVAKQHKIARAALQFLKQKKLPYTDIRFDVICILPGKIEHIENAFLPPRVNI